ncbi:MAG: DUF3540 domain-containing protein [Deltaproteobacteria bacterium]|nr:DUF3540 domain-containing protein [Deltaproteobacteria bacterium]
MNRLARELSADVTQEQGLVLRRDGDSFVVRAGSGDFRARRAVSCLVEPQTDDLVLVAATERGTCYVLAVLERDEGAPTRLVAEGDLEIAAERGRVSITAKEELALASSHGIELAAASLGLKALDARLVAERIDVVGRGLSGKFERIKAYATSLDSVFDRWSQRVKRSYRTVEEADHLRAERIDYEAQRTVNLHGQNTVVTAQEIVKVDGGQILVG